MIDFEIGSVDVATPTSDLKLAKQTNGIVMKNGNSRTTPSAVNGSASEATKNGVHKMQIDASSKVQLNGRPRAEPDDHFSPIKNENWLNSESDEPEDVQSDHQILNLTSTCFYSMTKLIENFKGHKSLCFVWTSKRWIRFNFFYLSCPIIWERNCNKIMIILCSIVSYFIISWLWYNPKRLVCVNIFLIVIPISGRVLQLLRQYLCKSINTYLYNINDFIFNSAYLLTCVKLCVQYCISK